jgi:bifunctional UDP-N-acetylglucosamine pyrophosphorylase/glucosamine-1-phosphate N-acetyltransferase
MMVKGIALDTGRRKLGVIMGDNVNTGIRSSFMPGVKVGENALVGANLMVERDLPADSVSLFKQSCKVEQGNKGN